MMKKLNMEYFVLVLMFEQFEFHVSLLLDQPEPNQNYHLALPESRKQNLKGYLRR